MKRTNFKYKKLNRDLNVNSQGLKHNFEKVQGVFAKLPGPVNFQN
jgi:hypothetical protein